MIGRVAGMQTPEKRVTSGESLPDIASRGCGASGPGHAWLIHGGKENVD
jgi:hypothetical protein